MAIKAKIENDEYMAYRTEDTNRNGNLKPGAVTARADRPAQAIAALLIKLEKGRNADYH